MNKIKIIDAVVDLLFGIVFINMSIDLARLAFQDGDLPTVGIFLLLFLAITSLFIAILHLQRMVDSIFDYNKE